MTGAAPIVRKLTDIPGFLISPDDTVRLAELAGPTHGTSASIFLEIWEPGGALIRHGRLEGGIRADERVDEVAIDGVRGIRSQVGHDPSQPGAPRRVNRCER